MPPRTPRILIVEDEPGDARLMQLALQKCDIAVEMDVAGDGLEALRFLRRQDGSFSAAQRPDLILLDLKMPGQSGLEFLQEVKREDSLRAIPVVVVSTSTLEADVLAVYRLGGAGFMQKPTDLNEFMDAINKLGQYWFQLVRLPQKRD